jgi:hypothetical protein
VRVRFAVVQLSLNLQACDDNVKRVCYEFRDNGSQSARRRMAKGRKSRADSAMLFLFVGNVIKGEGILGINVSLCSVFTCWERSRAASCRCSSSCRNCRWRPSHRYREKSLLKKDQLDSTKASQTRGKLSWFAETDPHRAPCVTSCRRHGGVWARPELQRIAELQLNRLRL